VELPCHGDCLGRTVVGVLGVEEQDCGEDVLEEALANVIRHHCRRRVEVVVPETVPFWKS